MRTSRIRPPTTTTSPPLREKSKAPTWRRPRVRSDPIASSPGTAKFLPNPDGSGGKHCTKGNVELTGSGPGCAFKPFESMLVVIESDYTYNGDGTLCERARLVGGPLAGTEFPFHTYVDTNGRWLFVTTQDIAYPCPNAASNDTGLNSQGPGFKIGRFGDDPPGSGVLPYTNP